MLILDMLGALQE